MKARDYQLTAIDKVNENLRVSESTLLVMCTGTGKTIVFSKLCEHWVRIGARILILAHTGELLEQARDKIAKSIGLSCAMEKAEYTCIGTFDRIVVGSIQTLCQEKRLAKFPRDYFDFIITDEAHRSMSKSYLRIYDYFNQSKLFGTRKMLGVTATPDRSDMQQLGDVYDSLAFEYSLPMAISQGYLVPIKAQTVPINIDLTAISKPGEFTSNDIGNVLEPYLEVIADEMIEFCRNRKTVVFLPLIKISQEFQKYLDDRGFNTFEVNGGSHDRDQLISDFDKAGPNSVMLNSMLLTEGWDCESVDCIIPLRPTKSRPLYVQIVGRGTRPVVAHEISQEGLTYEDRRKLIADSDKPDLLLLDFLWNVGKHDLVRPAHLVQGDNEVAKAMTKRIEEDPEKQFDISDEQLNDDSVNDVLEDRKASLAKKLDEAKKKGRLLVNPIEFEMSIQDKDLTDYVPTKIWEMSPVTEKQKSALEKLGIGYDTIPNSGKASLILDRANKRKDAGLSTPRQFGKLKKYGFKDSDKWTFDQARKMITRIAGMGWRGVPAGVDPKTYVPK